jgi:peptidoglycan-associated lipoprotein
MPTDLDQGFLAGPRKIGIGKEMIKQICWLALPGLMVACSQTPAPSAPERGFVEATPRAKQETSPAREENVASISISDEIRNACGLQEKDAYFDFDSARVTPQADRVLAGLATCFTAGPLKGKGMKLVGHADPRGDSEYNLVLGGKRADHVSSALAKKGLEHDRMLTSSRGELDATGQDESGWAKDRRVDVMLAD